MNRELRPIFVFLALALLGILLVSLLLFQSLRERSRDADERTQALGALMCHVTRSHAERNINQGAHSNELILTLEIEPGGRIEIIPECLPFAEQLRGDNLKLEDGVVIIEDGE